ncbi:amidase [Ancylobacter amanitiformis]|uniref:Indoleacetamide hydrolase n=1 Tax=Ancylobacter amanitiformis TaxID=217069 RepID=A0ABU0LWR2_9HYPH|nr:amidase [Ancylobacter amanitiformis]MDQ0513156.1 aspartyl-tRNA(Asn)/glutamyl-tRNA(Gln) amidotransferase subunit A [Ancylobacter amanitiformis]
MSDLTRLSLRKLRRLMVSGEVRPEEVTAAFLARAEARNSRDLSYVSIGAEEALACASRVERAGASGRLAGIPFSCKDVFDTVTLPTTAGSRAMDDYRPIRNAQALERLKASGAILLGKNNLHEFCYGITGANLIFGTPANPHDPGRLAGGSSSGSAVAVANRTAMFALGTDTGGSVRVPASLCGLVGFKPTHGQISLKGVVPFCWSLDHAGILARSCGDATEVFLAVREADEAILATNADHAERGNSLHGLRIGVPRGAYLENVASDIALRVQQLIAECRRLGAHIIDVVMPDATHVRTASLAVQLVEAFAWHRTNLQRRFDLYGEDVREGLLQGQFILAEHYVQALRLIAAKQAEVSERLKDIDVLMTPTTPIVAPALDQKQVTLAGVAVPVGNALSHFTCLFNLTGHPALTVPISRDGDGLPIGVQLIGAHHRDMKLLAIGAALERVGLAGWIEPNDEMDDGTVMRSPLAEQRELYAH